MNFDIFAHIYEISRNVYQHLEDVHLKAMEKVKVETAAALKAADIQAQKHMKEKDNFIKELKQLTWMARALALTSC